MHFGPDDLVKDGFVHFGFHDRSGRQFAIEHQQHFLGLVGDDDRLEWTAAAQPVFAGVPNIAADLQYPMYVDALPDGSLVVSNFGTFRVKARGPRQGRNPKTGATVTVPPRKGIRFKASRNLLAA